LSVTRKTLDGERQQASCAPSNPLLARLRSRLNENAAMVGIVHKGMKKSRRLDSAGVGWKR
jgi:hypothetical protein